MSMLGGVAQEAFFGGLITAGFDPLIGDGNTRSASFGGGLARFDFERGTVLPTAISYRDPTSGGWMAVDKLRDLPMAGGMGAFVGRGVLLGVGVGGTAYNAALGYQRDGIVGAGEELSYDISQWSALHRYHYQKAASWAPGTLGKAATAGDAIARQGIFSGGKFESWTNPLGGNKAVGWGRRIYNTGTFMAKGMGGFGGSLVGSIIGGGIGGAVAGRPGEFIGGIGGTVAGTYAGTAAVAAIGASGPVGWGAAGLAAAGVATMAAGAAGVAAAGYGTYQTLKAGYRYRQMQKGIHTSGSLAAFHTQGAQTMRARAVQAIHKSHLNARSALGQEANFMHFPSRNYSSRYRRFY